MSHNAAQRSIHLNVLSQVTLNLNCVGADPSNKEAIEGFFLRGEQKPQELNLGADAAAASTNETVLQGSM